MKNTFKFHFAVITLFVLTFKVGAQTAPFQIAIEPFTINGLGGIQSFAWGQHNGKWLILGGRLDGLHRRQPFAAFDVAGNNNQVIVVDPVSLQLWTATLSTLPVDLQEQLQSTNMEFYQEGNYLYLAGGYGYSNSAADHITYPYLSAVHVPDVIDAVVNGLPLTTGFRQLYDTMFAVTGGYMNKINSMFYLTGGQRFIGRYNPMGPTHGPGFIQRYTNAIRRFTLTDNGSSLIVNHLPEINDSINLHRRDYNVVPQILPGGDEGLTAFSGVFREGLDLPFLNCVNIDSVGYSVNNSFSQYYNHYHCAHLPLYSSFTNEMHTVFFGGIAQYYDSIGILVQDDNVPFVKTIARVTREANGVMSEYKLPVEMPTLLGAGSEFIPNENLSRYSNGVIKLDSLAPDTTFVGYIYGGISSTAANIFFTNTGIESSASNQLFRVYVIKNPGVGIHSLNSQSTGTLQMQVYPNPNSGSFVVNYTLRYPGRVTLTVSKPNGELLEKSVIENSNVGANTLTKSIRDISKSGVYILTLETESEKAIQKLILNRD